MSDRTGVGSHNWIARLRTSFKRRVVWPVAGRLVRTPAWDAALVGYATIESAGFRPGRRTDVDPLALRWIDPARPLADALPPAPERPPIGRVEGGDWDLVDDRFAGRPVPRAIELRFREGKPWEETPLSDHVRDQVERFGDAWGHVEAAVERRSREIEALYEAIRADGFRTQAELAVRGDGGPGPPPIPTLGEITVDVGRDGRLCWRRNGQHRLAIARVLGVDRVPVLVARRHEKWQDVRDRIREGGVGGVNPTLLGHPDLVDLTGSAGVDGP